MTACRPLHKTSFTVSQTCAHRAKKIQRKTLKRLERKVTIRISPHKPGEPYQEVGFSL
jgi:hypothetical protein